MEREGNAKMMKESDKWQAVEEKLEELKKLVDENKVYPAE
tara:strand:- start:629 stop:748 length:120 start_codon:yes stop_codon:yes gene_type:complete